tara:strand:+ start:219 stop:449 length:231 start_codon:yes stop_codon:yes gene_type:complete
MNKKGRKYDREKWGWKSEDDINEHCHYSGLPSPAAYEDKHPYYDSNKKKKTEKFSLQAIGICVIVMLTLAILSLLL